MKVLVVVDMQNDFIGGALGSAEAQAVVASVCEKIRSFDGHVIYTRDTHQSDYLTTQEGAFLPVVHCIEGTEGHALHPEIEALRQGAAVIDKPAFGSPELAQSLSTLHAAQPIESITLVGVCTDICVISNAMLLKAFLPEVPLYVDAACCAGVTPESHLRALESMKTCQIHIV